jgi:hypothetical protein
MSMGDGVYEHSAGLLGFSDFVILGSWTRSSTDRNLELELNVDGWVGLVWILGDISCLELGDSGDTNSCPSTFVDALVWDEQVEHGYLARTFIGGFVLLPALLGVCSHSPEHITYYVAVLCIMFVPI